MHPSIQTTYTDLARTLSGLTVKAEKPVRVVSVKQTPDTSVDGYIASDSDRCRKIRFFRHRYPALFKFATASVTSDSHLQC